MLLNQVQHTYSNAKQCIKLSRLGRRKCVKVISCTAAVKHCKETWFALEMPKGTLKQRKCVKVISCTVAVKHCKETWFALQMPQGTLKHRREDAGREGFKVPAGTLVRHAPPAAGGGSCHSHRSTVLPDKYQSCRTNMPNSAYSWQHTTTSLR